MTHAQTVAWSLIREDPDLLVEAIAAIMEGRDEQGDAFEELADFLVEHDRTLRALGCDCSECVQDARARALTSELARSLAQDIED